MEFNNISLTFFQVSLMTTILILSVSGYRPCQDSDVIRYAQPQSDRDATPRPNRMLGTVGLHRSHDSHAITAIPDYSSDENLPWHCQEIRTWRDLGESYFPRFLPEVRCLNSTCLNGHYSCKPVLYTVKVLTNNDKSCRDLSLPPSLRRHWVLANVETAATCTCQTW